MGRLINRTYITLTVNFVSYRRQGLELTVKADTIYQKDNSETR